MKIIINNITETTYKNGTSFLSYKVDNRMGYDITADYVPEEEHLAEFDCNTDENIIKKYSQKPHISICSEYLQKIIINCLESENDMFFVEYQDISKKQLLELEEEVDKLGLSECILFNVDGCAATVYGNTVTKFLYDCEK